MGMLLILIPRPPHLPSSKMLATLPAVTPRKSAIRLAISPRSWPTSDLSEMPEPCAVAAVFWPLGFGASCSGSDQT